MQRGDGRGEEEEQQQEEGRGLVSRENCVAGNIETSRRTLSHHALPHQPPEFIFSPLSTSTHPCLTTTPPAHSELLHLSRVHNHVNLLTHSSAYKNQDLRRGCVRFPSRPFHDGGWSPKRVPARRNTPRLSKRPMRTKRKKGRNWCHIFRTLPGKQVWFRTKRSQKVQAYHCITLPKLLLGR